jgi:nucleoid DNA-binding protein
MNDALVRGHRIEIRGFGSFTVNRRAPRQGRNPRSGASVDPSLDRDYRSSNKTGDMTS